MFVKRFYLESLQVLITHSIASLDPKLCKQQILGGAGERVTIQLLVSCCIGMLKGIAVSF